jgi:peroxiredoxin
MPNVVALATEYAAKGVETVAISVDEGGPDLVRKFVDKYKIPFPVAMAGASNPITSGVTGIPVTLLIDREGNSAVVYVGMISEDTVRRDLNSLLAEK